MHSNLSENVRMIYPQDQPSSTDWRSFEAISQDDTESEIQVEPGFTFVTVDFLITHTAITHYYHIFKLIPPGWTTWAIHCTSFVFFPFSG